jgi:hypothetical protein
VFPVSGVYGGVNGQMQVVAHFFLEYPKIPATTTATVSIPDGKMEVQDLASRPGEYTREIFASILVNPDLSRSIGAWFIEQADRATSALATPVEQALENTRTSNEQR